MPQKQKKAVREAAIANFLDSLDKNRVFCLPLVVPKVAVLYTGVSVIVFAVVGEVEVFIAAKALNTLTDKAS